MTRSGKAFADLRDRPGIPYWDVYGQRRSAHSIRHWVCSAAMPGWVKNSLHRQQRVGNEKSGGIAKRCLRTFPLSSASYGVDGVNGVEENSQA